MENKRTSKATREARGVKVIGLALTVQQEKAASMLASGMKAIHVAKELKISNQTITAWMKNIKFNQEINRLVRLIQEEHMRFSVSALGLAFATIIKIAKDEEAPHSVRLAAASKLIDSCSRYYQIQLSEEVLQIRQQLEKIQFLEHTGEVKRLDEFDFPINAETITLN